MRLIIILIMIGGCSPTIKAPEWYGRHPTKYFFSNGELSYICSNNARLAKRLIANISTGTTVAELVSWIKIDQHAWQEMASDLDSE